MARLLVRLEGRSHPDPGKDALITHEGDIVVVRPDGWVWGSEEGLPTYGHVDLPGEDWKGLLYLTEPEVRFTQLANASEGDGELVVLTKRLHRVQLVDLPAMLTSQGRATVSRNALDAVVRNKQVERSGG